MQAIKPFEVYSRTNHLKETMPTKLRVEKVDASGREVEKGDQPLKEICQNHLLSFLKNSAVAATDDITKWWNYSINVLAKVNPHLAEMTNPVIQQGFGGAANRMVGKKEDGMSRLTALLSDRLIGGAGH